MKNAIKTFLSIVGYSITKSKPRTRPFLNDHANSVGLLPQDKLKDILCFFDKIDPLYKGVSGPLAIGGAWLNLIKDERKNQLKIVLQQGIEREADYRALLENMFRNELIKGIQNYGHFEDADFLSDVFMDSIKDFCYMTGRSIGALCQTNEFGNPWGLKVPEGIVKYVDTWHGIQADSAIKLLEISSLAISDSDQSERLTVADLGSGFGGTIEKIARWYNRKCLFLLIDIPINLTTSYAYISSTFPRNRTTIVSNVEELKDALSTHDDEAHFVFVPTLLVEALENIKIHVLLNAGSLSEMDYGTIEFYLRILLSNQTDWFIEWNSHTTKEVNRGHKEISSSSFPVPSTFKLVSRKPLWRSDPNERYLGSVWVNSKFFIDKKSPQQ